MSMIRRRCIKCARNAILLQQWNADDDAKIWKSIDVATVHFVNEATVGDFVRWLTDVTSFASLSSSIVFSMLYRKRTTVYCICSASSCLSCRKVAEYLYKSVFWTIIQLFTCGIPAQSNLRRNNNKWWKQPSVG